MYRPVWPLWALLFPLLGQTTPDPTDFRGWLNKGVQEYKGARYVEAAAAFQNAVNLNPSSAPARLYLATTWMAQYIPGSDDPENLLRAAKAEQEFNQALLIHPADKIALASIASLNYNQKKFDEAKTWYAKLLAVDPSNKEAYYTLGVIAWSQYYPAYGKARGRLGMKPEEPGPIADATVKMELKNQYGAIIDEGMANLHKALALDPRYDDAMAYLNLLIRERADLLDSKEEYRQAIIEADEWVRKALATKKEKAEANTVAARNQTPAPPPAPQRIRVGSNVQAASILQSVDPVYPPLAKQARVQGTVRLNVQIGADGHVSNITVLSGHPLLVPAALEAVRQWIYKPTLLNGEPVQVVTEASVNFTLPPNP